MIVLILNASGELNPFKSTCTCARASPTPTVCAKDQKCVWPACESARSIASRLLAASEVGTASNPQKIEAFLTIDSKIDGVPATDRIRSDSTAQQASPSMLGSEMMVNITPGTPLGQPVKENVFCCLRRPATP